VIFHTPISKNPSHGPCPAIVQEVLDGGRVRLFVFGQKGYVIEENVAQGTKPGEWSWPERVQQGPTPTQETATGPIRPER